MSSPHTTIASKTTYDALAVESGEDSEEEVLTDSVDASRYPRISSHLFGSHISLGSLTFPQSRPSQQLKKRKSLLVRREDYVKRPRPSKLNEINGRHLHKSRRHRQN